MLMSVSSSNAVIALTSAFPYHLLLVAVGSASVLALLVYVGVVLPAVWSAKPARRQAAAAVLRQILVTLRRR
jgi:hypothetical protein